MLSFLPKTKLSDSRPKDLQEGYYSSRSALHQLCVLPGVLLIHDDHSRLFAALALHPTRNNVQHAYIVVMYVRTWFDHAQPLSLQRWRGQHPCGLNSLRAYLEGSSSFLQETNRFGWQSLRPTTRNNGLSSILAATVFQAS